MQTDINAINLADNEHRKAIEEVRAINGEHAVVTLIKEQMPKIMEHYIGCTWGACCHMKFVDLIQPYFDDVALIDQILRSSLIKDRSNVIRGRTGARIFDLLLTQLRKCKSQEIKIYLRREFT